MTHQDNGSITLCECGAPLYATAPGRENAFCKACGWNWKEDRDARYNAMERKYENEILSGNRPKR